MSHSAIATLFFVLACGQAVSKGEESPLPVEGAADSFRSPTHHGELTLGDPVASTLTADGQYHTWTFELSGLADVKLTTDGAVDTVLYLYQWNGERWGRYRYRNDDYDGTKLSRIARSLGEGRYRALVKGYSDAEQGPFALLSTCTGEGCGPAIPAPSSCFLGTELRDLRESAAFEHIATRRATSPSDLYGIEYDQVLRAVRVSDDRVETIAEAFTMVDASEVNLEVYRDEGGVFYRVVEYGAGDNSYGAVFVAEQVEVVAAIVDGFFERCGGQPVEVEGVAFTAAEAAASLAYANEATESEMRADEVYSRAIPNIIAARPIADLPTLAAIPQVGPATLEDIRRASTLPSGCSAELRVEPALTGILQHEQTDACQPAGGFCSIDTVDRLRVQSCGHELDELASLAIMSTGLIIDEYRGIHTMGREALAQRPHFQFGLLEAMDAEVTALGGSTNGLRARTYEDETSCHNCTELLAGAVVEYPEAGVAYVISGSFGWDS